MILGSSYALFNREIFNTENGVIVQSGELQVVVSSQSEMIEMNYNTSIWWNRTYLHTI